MLNSHLSGFAEYAMEGDETRKNWVDQGVEVRLCDMRRDVDQWIVNATFIQLQQKHSCHNQTHNLDFHLGDKFLHGYHWLGPITVQIQTVK